MIKQIEGQQMEEYQLIKWYKMLYVYTYEKGEYEESIRNNEKY